jgi:hypothetical protein
MSYDEYPRPVQVAKSISAGFYEGLTEQEVHEAARYGINRHQRRKALTAIRREARRPKFNGELPAAGRQL